MFKNIEENESKNSEPQEDTCKPLIPKDKILKGATFAVGAALPQSLVQDVTSIDALNFEIVGHLSDNQDFQLSPEQFEKAVNFATKKSAVFFERASNIIIEFPKPFGSSSCQMILWCGHANAIKQSAALKPRIRFVGNLNRVTLDRFESNGIVDPKARRELSAVLPDHAGLKENHPSSVVFKQQDMAKEVFSYQLKALLPDVIEIMTNTLVEFGMAIYGENTRFRLVTNINRLEVTQDLLLDSSTHNFETSYLHLCATYANKITSPFNMKPLIPSSFDIQPTVKEGEKIKRNKPRLLLGKRESHGKWSTYVSFAKRKTACTVYFSSSHKNTTKAIIQLVWYPFLSHDKKIVRIEPSFRTKQSSDFGVKPIVFLKEKVEELARFHLDRSDLANFSPHPGHLQLDLLMKALGLAGVNEGQKLALIKGHALIMSNKTVDKLPGILLRLDSSKTNSKVKLHDRYRAVVLSSFCFGLNEENPAQMMILDDDELYREQNIVKLIANKLSSNLKMGLSKLKRDHPHESWSLLSDASWYRRIVKIKELFKINPKTHAQLKDQLNRTK